MKLSYLLFFTVFLTVYLTIHYYVYNRVVNGLMLNTWFRICIGLFFFIFAVLFIAGEILARNRIQWGRPVYYLGGIWFGIISIAFTIFIFRDIFFMIFRKPFSGYSSTIFVLVILFFTSLYSIYNGLKMPVLKELRLQFPKLPENLRGFSIVQLSDLHLNSYKSTKWLEGIVNETNINNPDLIVITGDLIDADLSEFNGFCETLQNLKSKYGVFAITGNHEFYAGIDKFMEFSKNSNISVLRNKKIPIEDSIELIGIDDRTGRRFPGNQDDFEQVMKDPDTGRLIIVLSHQPDIFKKNSKHNYDLQLSGHTHAGQIPPMDLIVKFYYKHPYGLYKEDLSYIYTSCGTGVWALPMRLFSRSEIIKIVLDK